MTNLALFYGPDSTVTEQIAGRERFFPDAGRARELQTGDIVLFSGNTLAAKTVRWFTASRWSHVGLILRHPAWGNEPLLWEATRASPLKDLATGSMADGVQLVKLADKVAAYPGQVVVRCWRDLGERPGPDQVSAVFERYHSLPYRDYVRRNVHRWLGDPERERTKGTFCSEFVAEVLQAWGLVCPGRPVSRFVPADFAEERRPLPVRQGRLAEPVRL